MKSRRTARRYRKKGQLELFRRLSPAKAATLGGSDVRSHAKRPRPLAPRSTVHLVLKSEKARGDFNFLRARNRAKVEQIVRRQARKFFVRIEEFANVGNHLHIRAYVQAPTEFRNFLRSIACLIARHVTGARRGKKFGRFWSGLAFTRLIRTVAEKVILSRYIFANRLESAFGRETRDQYLSLWYG